MRRYLRVRYARSLAGAVTAIVPVRSVLDDAALVMRPLRGNGMYVSGSAQATSRVPLILLGGGPVGTLIPDRLWETGQTR